MIGNSDFLSYKNNNLIVRAKFFLITFGNALGQTKH